LAKPLFPGLGGLYRFAHIIEVWETLPDPTVQPSSCCYRVIPRLEETLMNEAYTGTFAEIPNLQCVKCGDLGLPWEFVLVSGAWLCKDCYYEAN
jgi:hypothetical protein